MVTDPQTQPQPHPQTGLITIHCTVKLYHTTHLSEPSPLTTAENEPIISACLYYAVCLNERYRLLFCYTVSQQPSISIWSLLLKSSSARPVWVECSSQQSRAGEWKLSESTLLFAQAFDCCWRVFRFTVKPVLFACPLFREFRDLGNLAKIAGR